VETTVIQRYTIEVDESQLGFGLSALLAPDERVLFSGGDPNRELDPRLLLELLFRALSA
jgi:hypothetical protein